MPALTLGVLAAIFGYAVFRYGGVLPEDWYPCLTALGITSAVYFLTANKADRPPSPSLPFRLLLFAFLAVVILQLIPLPVGLVRLVSPMRSEVHEALAPVLGESSRTTLTIVPAETLRLLLTVSAYVVLFFVLRDLMWRFRKRPWAVVIPVVVVALLEAILGLVQYRWAGAPMATGTYVNRNHYSGLLEMALPFAVMGAVAALRTDKPADSHQSPAGPALKACVWLSVGAVILLAIIHSLSRMGFIAALGSCFVMGAAALGGGLSGRKRVLPVSLVAVLVVAGFIFLPTDQLIERFADIAATEDISADARAEIWRDTGHLIRDYALFGCGLGCYQSGFHRYKTVAPMRTVDFAHNDYLQLLAEVGVVGFVILLALGGRTISRAADASSRMAGTHERYLGVACLGSLTAIALHSLVDFNLYIAANGMLFVWVAGMTEGLRFIGLRRRAGRRERKTPTFLDSKATVVDG